MSTREKSLSESPAMNRLVLRTAFFTFMLAALVLGAAVLNLPAGDATKEQHAKTEKSETKLPVETRVANFILPDASGKSIALSDFDSKSAVVLYFMGTNCPISN